MPEATFVVWEVQHGSAAYVHTPGGKHIAVDLGTGSVGTSNSAFSPLLHLPCKGGVGQLDGLVITRPHRDHLGDIANLRTVPTKVLARPKHLTARDVRSDNERGTGGVIERYLELDGRSTVPLKPGESPFEASVNGGLEMQIFTPTDCPRSNLNNHSLVVVACYAGLKIVIPGDNEEPSRRELLKTAEFRKAIKGTDVLVAPHHGRQAGFSSELFRHITPRLTIISDGPASATSATELYRRHTHKGGWTVHKRSGGTEKRRCLTTRKDGVVAVRFGQNRDGSTYLNVRVD
ncbi:MAG: MBL fold metallo-hydrolase [Chloroflexota bacterium]|nr:MBL fold metallo-hydrolase [Chloroflexota bacterium]